MRTGVAMAANSTGDRADRAPWWLLFAGLVSGTAACTTAAGPAAGPAAVDAANALDAPTTATAEPDLPGGAAPPKRDASAGVDADARSPVRARLDGEAPADSVDGLGGGAAVESDGEGPEALAAETVAEVATAPDAGTPPTADAADVDAADAVSQATADASPDATAAKYGTCAALFGCVQKACSPDWPEYCGADCEAEASATALATWAMGAKCISGCQQKCWIKPAGCTQACVNEVCLFPKVVCLTAGLSGTANCSEVIACLETGCAAKDEACITACAAKASAAAKVDLQAMMECGASAGGKGLVFGCTQLMLQCMSGGKTGAASCVQTAGCADGCMQSGAGGEEACLGACHAKASPAAQQAFVPFFKCLLGAGAANNDCAGPLLVCVPGSGSAGCAAVAQCAGSCTATNPGSACTLGCLDKAAPGQVAKWLKLEGCMVGKCKSCLGKACEGACRDANCSEPWAACSSP